MPRSRSPNTTRNPTVTATSATDRVASSSSTSAERNEIRSVAIVSARWAASVRRSPSAWARARPKTCRVGRPATRSEKWCARRVWTRHRLRVRASVVQPTRAMNTGISGSVSATMIADVRSAVRIATPTITGTVTASMSWGRYLL